MRRLRGRSSAIAVIPPASAPPLWSDEFDGPAGQAPSSANWGYDIGRYGASSGEQQYYTNSTSNARLDGNGCLEIVVRKETPPDSAASPNDFTSARLRTRGKQESGPGAGPIRKAARIKVPYTKGLLPAFWTIGAGDNWPEDGEIDIMESPAGAAGADERLLALNLHGPTQGSPSVDKALSRGFRHTEPLGATFRTYGIDWYPDRILWHLDGRVRAVATQAEYAAVNGDWTPFSGPDHYMLLNIAVGNNWTGDPDGSSTFPQSMLVDWVRVWAL